MKSVKVSSSTIKVVKCSFNSFWYNDLIGSEFIIQDDSIRDFFVLHEGRIKSILKTDADFIDKKNPLI
jgi:hypothetical protein